MPMKNKWNMARKFSQLSHKFNLSEDVAVCCSMAKFNLAFASMPGLSSMSTRQFAWMSPSKWPHAWWLDNAPPLSFLRNFIQMSCWNWKTKLTQMTSLSWLGHLLLLVLHHRPLGQQHRCQRCRSLSLGHTCQSHLVDGSSTFETNALQVQPSQKHYITRQYKSSWIRIQ